VRHKNVREYTYECVGHLLLTDCQRFVLSIKNDKRNNTFQKNQNLSKKTKLEKFP